MFFFSVFFLSFFSVSTLIFSEIQFLIKESKLTVAVLNCHKKGQREKTISFFYCSDFRYESNGIFVLGVGFFFFRQISTF